MLKHRLTHPIILEALASAGHGARVLIADAHYPASTHLGENAELVYLNLSAGKPTVTEILDILLTAITVEAAAVMEREDGPEPTVFQEYRSLMPDIVLAKYNRFEFYEEAAGPDTCLTIVSGDTRLYSNLLLTLGVTL
jgi:L-fucose mutarotase